MSDPDEFVRTRPLGHWSDGNVSISGRRGPEPEAEEPAEEEQPEADTE